MVKIKRLLNIGALLLASCQAPLWQSGQEPDLRLNFYLTGQAATNQSPLPEITPRILFNNATQMVVTITPISNPGPAQRKEVSIPPGATNLAMEFQEVPIGVIQVTADAFDGTGAKVYTQTSTLELTKPNQIFVCNLIPVVPVNSTPVNLPYLILDQALTSGSRYFWKIPPGSPLIKTGKIGMVFGHLVGHHFFLQNTQGQVVNTQSNDGRHISFDPQSLANGGYLTYVHEGADLGGLYIYAAPSMVQIPGGVEPTNGRIIKPFLMETTETTQALYVGATFRNATQLTYPQFNVTFYDAIEICNNLSENFGLDPVYTFTSITRESGLDTPIISAIVTADLSKNGYRLPTLSERIWAARGGSTSEYYFGTESPINFEYYSIDSDSMVQAVGKKLPNGYGLYDLGGNLREWVWGDHPVQPEPVTAGGDFASDVTQLKVEFTNQDYPGEYQGKVGFRMVRSLDSQGTMQFQPLYQESFEGFTLNYLNGQNTWKGVKTGASPSGPVVIQSTVAPSQTIAIGFDQTGSTYGADAAVGLNFPSTLSSENYYSLQVDLVRNSWNSSFYLFADSNSDGLFSPSEVSLGVTIYGGGGSNYNVNLLLPSGTTKTLELPSSQIPTGSWARYNLSFHRQALWLQARAWNSDGTLGPWIPLFQEQNPGFDWASTTKTNPAKWTHLGFHFEGAGSFADNILFSRGTLP